MSLIQSDLVVKTCLLTKAQILARYRKTWAGFLWVLINPIVMYSAQATIFKHILRIDIPNYSTFLLGGLLPWIFITSTFEMGIPILLNSRETITTIGISPFVLIMAQVLDNFINCVAAMLIIFLFVYLAMPSMDLGILCLFPSLFILLLAVASATFFLAQMHVFFRDTRFIISFATNVLFFLTPIFYPRSALPTNLQILVDLNPFYNLILPIRNCIYDFNIIIWLKSALIALCLAFVCVLIAKTYWKKKKNEFYYYV